VFGSEFFGSLAIAGGNRRDLDFRHLASGANQCHRRDARCAQDTDSKLVR
jgi:hypothetical protein